VISNLLKILIIFSLKS